MTGPALTAELALNGEGGSDDSSNTDLSTALSIEDASKAFRTGKPADSKPPVSQPTADSDRPRNTDGTFAKLNADGTPVTQTPAADPAAQTDGVDDDAPADDADPDAEPTKSVEPKYLKLAGDAQRGEQDIELDITDLPPEAVKRLELNEQRGMRRNEYDQAVTKIHKADQDRIAFEAQLTMNPVGVVMEGMKPDQQVQVAAGVLLQHWDQMAPLIQTFWNDAEARMKALTEIREGSRTMSTQVSQQIQREQSIRSVGRTVDTLIPDGLDAITADEFRSAAWTRLNTLHASGTLVTLENIPTHLQSLAARYGFPDGGGPTPAEPPKRPKLAVRTSAQTTGTTPTNGTSSNGNGTPTVASMSPEQFGKKVRQQQGARAVAPQGAGGGSPITRPQIPQTATIEQASAALRGNARK